MGLTLRLLPGVYSVCRLEPGAAIPAWAGAPGFCSITRTAEELSIICATPAVPSEAKHEAGWALVQLVGPFAFNATGILSSVLGPLAKSGISSLAVATFDTDYLLIRESAVPEVAELLRSHGHTFLA